MIKYHFSEDEEKTRELLTMITKAINEENYGELSYIEEMELYLKEYDDINKNNAKLIEKLNNVISRRDDEISRLDDEISKREIELSELKLRIKNLEQQLSIQK